MTRPDISNSVRVVARYCSAPKMIHWKAEHSELGYALTISYFGISFQKGTLTGIRLIPFADAGYASRSKDRRSVSGWVVMCAGGGCFVVLQDAEVCDSLDYSGGVCGYVGHWKGDLFFRQVWCFMLPKARMPCIAMYEDNEGAIRIATHPISNSNSKHIDVRHRFLRELVKRKEVESIHVASQCQHADFLTKVLPEREFEFNRGIVMNSM